MSNDNFRKNLWDDKSKELLIGYTKDGLTATEVVIELGKHGYVRTRNAVIGQRHRMMMPPPDPNKIEQRKKRVEAAKAYNKEIASIVVTVKRKAPNTDITRIKMSDIPPDTSKAVLLTDSKDGQCKAIIGYQNNDPAKALYCGCEALPIMRNGKLSPSSWCDYHKKRYLNLEAYRR